MLFVVCAHKTVFSYFRMGDINTSTSERAFYTNKTISSGPALKAPRRMYGESFPPLHTIIKAK